MKIEETKREESLYVKLPTLIKDIILNATIPLPVNKDMVLKEIAEIKKITNAECESTLDYLRKLGIF